MVLGAAGWDREEVKLMNEWLEWRKWRVEFSLDKTEAHFWSRTIITGLSFFTKHVYAFLGEGLHHPPPRGIGDHKTCTQ